MAPGPSCQLEGENGVNGYMGLGAKGAGIEGALIRIKWTR